MKQRFDNDGNEMALPPVAEEVQNSEGSENDLGGEGSTDAVDENESFAMGRQNSLMEFAQVDEDALDYAVSTVRSKREDVVEVSATGGEEKSLAKETEDALNNQAAEVADNQNEGSILDEMGEIVIGIVTAAEVALDYAVSTARSKKEEVVELSAAGDRVTIPGAGEFIFDQGESVLVRQYNPNDATPEGSESITPFRTPDENDGSTAPVTPRGSEHEDDFKTPERSKTPEESPAKWGMDSSNSENQPSGASPVTSAVARAAGPAPEGVDQTWWEALTASPNRLLASWNNRDTGLNPGQLEISPEGENSGFWLDGWLPSIESANIFARSRPSVEAVAAPSEEEAPENHQASCPPSLTASTVGCFAVILLGVYFSGGFGDGSGSDL